MASSLLMRSGFVRAHSLPPIPIRSKLPVTQHAESSPKANRREVILRTSELAVLAAIFNFSGTKPNYLGVQKKSQTLALCPATKNCISTAEAPTDLIHYAPPWNYNPVEGRGKTKPVSRNDAMAELIQVIKSAKPDKYSPEIVEKTDDYLHVEYKSPILGFVDDVEFWFPPGKKSIVEYRSASRSGNFDFDINRKRIKASFATAAREERLGIRKQHIGIITKLFLPLCVALIVCFITKYRLLLLQQWYWR